MPVDAMQSRDELSPQSCINCRFVRIDNCKRYLKHYALKIKERIHSKFSEDPRIYSGTEMALFLSAGIFFLCSYIVIFSCIDIFFLYI